MRRKASIESEFAEPLRDVVAGYSVMGYSMSHLSDILEVSTSSMKHYCSRENIRFSRRPVEHREIRGRPPRLIRHNGRELSLSAWAWDLGVAPSTIHGRMRRLGRPSR